MLMAMLGFSSGLQLGVTRQFEGISKNTLFVWGQTSTMPYQGLPTGRRVRFDMTDISELRRLPDVDALAPRIQLGGFMTPSTATYGGKTGSFSILGDYPDMDRIVSQHFVAGRFINDRDITERRKVVVVGSAVVEQLYPPGADPIGTYIKINGVYFEVVGETSSQRSGHRAERDNNSMYVPFTAFQQAFHSGDRVGFFAMTALPNVDGAQVEREVKDILKRHHRIAPGDDLAIGSFNAFVEFRKMTDFFAILMLVSWFVGGATLLAGVVGVSNIMVITVKERTKEFGVRKALGARPLTIIAMVLKESVVLTAVAGLIGIAVGTGLIAAMDFAFSHAGPNTPLAPPQVGLGTALFAVTILVVSGALAGIMPAVHAAAIKPVEALRAE